MSYIFTTRNLKYRCLVDECEDNADAIYRTDWVKYAIPHDNNILRRCERFGLSDDADDVQTCSADFFNRTKVIPCYQFVYDDSDITVGREFNITCDNNLWMLTTVGTVSNAGELLSLPLSGFISDRHGRKTLMIVGVLWTTFAGLVRSFSPSYIPFVVMEFLDTLIGSGFYGAGFVLAMELVIPEQRVLGNTILSVAFVVGEVILGFAAWVSPSWRVLLRVLYGTGIFFISYIWLTQESIRWLLSKGRYEEAKKVLKKVAKANGTEISEDTIRKLNKIKEDNSKDESIWHIFRSARLVLRLINCCYCWICGTFIYYGLTLHSVSISGNMYVNYIAVAAVEIPAFFVCNYTLSRLGRRLTLAPAYILSGIACLLFIFVSDGMNLSSSTLQ
ncbi:solute carrier family 22 member [Holotrichia oblita]|uniref:Solute carrier family 22 member n=1 Tax=Holotrichia oblita TaxID=644536 RepID=A0ACB9SWT3_HOLOL|nr:solute carrier family 22 member [Holotrichia oblita]